MLRLRRCAFACARLCRARFAPAAARALVCGSATAAHWVRFAARCVAHAARDARAWFAFCGCVWFLRVCAARAHALRAHLRSAAARRCAHARRGLFACRAPPRFWFAAGLRRVRLVVVALHSDCVMVFTGGLCRTLRLRAPARGCWFALVLVLYVLPAGFCLRCTVWFCRAAYLLVPVLVLALVPV